MISALKIYLLLFVALQIKNAESLGWNDVCQISATNATCYIWPDNPPPWNKIDNYLHSAICGKTCILKLNPFTGTCATISECQNGTSATTTLSSPFPVLGGLEVRAPLSQITSMSETTRAKIQVSIDSSMECNAFKVLAEHVSFSSLDFSVDSSCETMNNQTQLSSYVPIVYHAGGAISLVDINSKSTVCTVLFVGKIRSQFATINLTTENVEMGNPVTPRLGPYAANHSFPIMLLNVSNIGENNCASSSPNILLIQQQFQQIADLDNPPCLTNLTLYYNDIPLNPFLCESVTVTKETNCHKRAATQLVLIIILVILIIVGLILLAFYVLPKFTTKLKTGMGNSHQKIANKNK